MKKYQTTIIVLFAVSLLLFGCTAKETVQTQTESATKETIENTEGTVEDTVIEETTEESTTVIIDESTESVELPTTEPSTEPYTEETESKPIISADHYSCDLIDIYCVSPVRTYTNEQKELIAKMLYCEAGSTSWDCQVANCSAIINLIEDRGGDFSILDDVNVYSPAYLYRNVTPMQMQYDVLEYVLSGNIIADIKYFRTNHYHPFGTPMFAIDNVYFSK